MDLVCFNIIWIIHTSLIVIINSKSFVYLVDEMLIQDNNHNVDFIRKELDDSVILVSFLTQH